MQKYTELNDEKYWKEIAEKPISEPTEKDYKPNIQDNELNTLIYLLKEYTKKKLNNSNSLLISYYQLYAIIFGGAYTLVFLCFQSHSLFNSNLVSLTYLILFFLPLFLYCALIKESWINKFIDKINSHFVRKKGVSIWYRGFLLMFMFLTLVLVLYIKLISFIPSRMVIPTCIIGLLILMTLKRLRDKYHNKNVIDQNLAKIIRVSSQAREHVYSGFGKKVELDVRLTEAEDVLKNPRLYF